VWDTLKPPTGADEAVIPEEQILMEVQPFEGRAQLDEAVTNLRECQPPPQSRAPTARTAGSKSAQIPVDVTGVQCRDR